MILHILKLTLLADLSGSLLMLLLFMLTDGIGLGIYVGILTFGNILLPSLGAVLIYQIIKRAATMESNLKTNILQSFLLLVLFVFGLYVWAVIDCILFGTLSFPEIQHDFATQFAGFLPAACSQAICIPILDRWLTQKN